MSGGTFAMAVEPLAVAPPPTPPGAVFVRLVQEHSANSQYLLEVVAAATTLRYADRHWIGDPADAAHPNVFYEGRLTIPIRIDRAMPLFPENERRVRRQFGTIEVANGDGGLDATTETHPVDGRQVRVLFGEYMGTYADFQVIADVIGEAWSPDDLRVRLDVRDRSYDLDAPLQSTLYAGTGGVEGTSEVEGKPKPLLFGRCRNVTPTLIDPTNLVYQVHDGGVESIDEVYDRGLALTATGEDAIDYATLITLPIPAGNYSTSLRAGMFRLASTPDGLITSDVRGDADGGYENTIDPIALRIILDRAGIASNVVDSGSFASAVTIAGECGIYVSSAEAPATSDVLNRLMGSVGAWWGSGRTGKIVAGKLIPPENESTSYEFDEFNILELESLPAPVPRWQQRVGFQTNWTIQEQDIAGAVTAERRQLLAEPHRVVVDNDAAVLAAHLRADDPPVLGSSYESEADAASLAAEMLDLYSADRRLFEITVKQLSYIFNLGDIVKVTWPRLGLDAGKNFTIIGLREDAATEVAVLTLWG